MKTLLFYVSSLHDFVRPQSWFLLMLIFTSSNVKHPHFIPKNADLFHEFDIIVHQFCNYFLLWLHETYIKIPKERNEVFINIVWTICSLTNSITKFLMNNFLEYSWHFLGFRESFLDDASAKGLMYFSFFTTNAHRFVNVSYMKMMKIRLM